MIDSTVIDNTEISGKPRVTLDAPVSPLLDDSAKRRLFAEYFASTSIEGPDLEGRVAFTEFFAPTWTDLPLDIHARLESAVSDWVTPLHTERSVRHPTRTLVRAEPTDVDPVTKVTEERIQLLARKYVAKEKYSDEERARLAIVTERVRKLLPAVTVREFEALEQVLTSLRDITKENASLRDKLRLAPQEDA